MKLKPTITEIHCLIFNVLFNIYFEKMALKTITPA